MPHTYRKRPVVVQAALLKPGNIDKVAFWCGGTLIGESSADLNAEDTKYIEINTLEGIMRADIGDYVVRGVEGEFYPVKPSIFLQTYELVE